MPDEKLWTIFVKRQNVFFFFVIAVSDIIHSVLNILDNWRRKKYPNVERCYRRLYYIIIVTIFHFFFPIIFLPESNLISTEDVARYVEINSEIPNRSRSLCSCRSDSHIIILFTGCIGKYVYIGMQQQQSKRKYSVHEQNIIILKHTQPDDGGRAHPRRFVIL